MENKMPKKTECMISTSATLFLNKKSSVVLSCVTQIIPERTAPRYNDCPLIWLCIKGKIILHTENGDFFCSPGSAVIIPPGTMYYPEFFNEEYLFYRVYTEYNAYQNVDHAAYINSITHLLLPPFSHELGFVPTRMVALSPASFKEAKNLFEAPSLKNIEKFFTLPEFTLTTEQKKAALSLVPSRLLPMLTSMTYIQENYALKITADDLIEVSGLCRTNLFSVFRKYLGISHAVYHIMIRVKRAQYAIAHTQYSLQYISDMCGFATLSHMSKCYKKYKGLLPKVDRAMMKEYRKMYPNIYVSHDYFFNE